CQSAVAKSRKRSTQTTCQTKVWYMLVQHTRILRLNKAGLPLQWLSREEAATLLVKGLVVWSLGENAVTIRGGTNRLGLRSELAIPAIIATDGDIKHNDHHVPAVCNRLLFRR